MNKKTISLEDMNETFHGGKDKFMISILHNWKRTVFVVMISRENFPIEKGNLLLVVGDIYNRSTPFLIHDISDLDPEHKKHNYEYVTDVTLLYPLGIIAGQGFLSPKEDCKRYMRWWTPLDNIEIKLPSVTPLSVYQVTNSVIPNNKSSVNKSSVFVLDSDSALEVTHVVMDKENGILGLFNHESRGKTLLFTYVFPKKDPAQTNKCGLPFVCAGGDSSFVGCQNIQQICVENDNNISNTFCWAFTYGNTRITETELIVDKDVEIITLGNDREGEKMRASLKRFSNETNTRLLENTSVKSFQDCLKGKNKTLCNGVGTDQLNEFSQKCLSEFANIFKYIGDKTYNGFIEHISEEISIVACKKMISGNEHSLGKLSFSGNQWKLAQFI